MLLSGFHANTNLPPPLLVFCIHQLLVDPNMMTLLWLKMLFLKRFFRKVMVLGFSLFGLAYFGSFVVSEGFNGEYRHGESGYQRQ